MRARRKRKTETANTARDITLSCFARDKERYEGVDKSRGKGGSSHSKCSKTSVRVPIATCCTRHYDRKINSTKCTRYVTEYTVWSIICWNDKQTFNICGSEHHAL